MQHHALKRLLWTSIATCVLVSASPASADFIDHLSTLDDVGRGKVPAVGESRILVIPVEVEDDDFRSIKMDELRHFFDPNTTGEFAFTEFYERMSMGAYRPVATVIDPIRFETCPLPEDYFGYRDCRIPRSGGSSVDQTLASLDAGLSMLELVLEKVKESGVDFSEFDINGKDGNPDGWIDGVLLIHNIRFGGIAFPIYWLRENVALEEQIVYDGVKVNIVGIADSNAIAVHEFGHLLGWADLYDESGKSKGLQYSFMGSWDYIEQVHSLDPFSRIQAGWTTPTVYDVGDVATDVRLRPAPDSGDVIQLGTGNEYFLIENRTPVAGDYIDAGLTARGLAIYHVNLKRLPPPTEGQWTLRLINCVNCDTWRPMLMNEQADGLFELQLPGNRRDDRNDLFQPGSAFVPNLLNTEPLGADSKSFSSNRYDGAVTGISVTNIREDGDDILLDITVEDPCTLLNCGTGTCEDGKCLCEVENCFEEPEPQPDAGVATPDTSTENPDEDTGVEEVPSDDGGGGGCAVAPANGHLSGVGVWLMMVLGMVWARRFV